MSGNTLGHLFCVTNFGESHGTAIGCVVDGCPPNLELSAVDIQLELDRRRPGTSRYVTQRQEQDQVEILSGVFNGKTTGAPIALLIPNQDQRSKDYQDLVHTFRPGHADYTYFKKYGIRDFRGGGRSSARLTAPTVAAGAIAKKWLHTKYKINIQAALTQLGPIIIPIEDWEARANNPFFAATNSSNLLNELGNYVDALRKEGNSTGARVHIMANSVPAGWGNPIYNKLDADIAYAMMGINAVKGVEIGAGFQSVTQKGSEHSDEITPQGFLTNHSGGILGGISSGQEITVTIAIKPTSSIRLPRQSINEQGESCLVQTLGRHDPCVGIRAVPIAEAVLALVLIDHALQHQAICSHL